MRSLDFKSKWVLVTGASSGLGKEIAIQLATKHQANLIISARRADRLNELKAQLEQQAGVRVKVVVADLSVPEDAGKLVEASTTGQELYAAILNAGVTYFGPHTDIPDGDFECLLQTNVSSVAGMITQLIKYFEVTKREAGIMAVTSMAALFPVPYQAAYSGTKAFITSFMFALSQELTNPQLSLTVYAPGGIATEMTEGEKFSGLKKWLMPVEQAASEGIYALRNRKDIYLPGALNRIGSKFLKLLPRKFVIRQMAGNYRKSLFKK